MVRKAGQARGQLPTVQSTPPIRFAPEDKQVPVTKAQVARSRSIFSFLSGLVARLGIVYVLVAVFWRCPSQPFSFDYSQDHSLLVCRELASAQEHIAPAFDEFATCTRKHLDPYVGTYLDKAEDAWKNMKPMISQSATHAHTIFTTHVEPGARELAKQAHTWSLPHQKTAHRHYKKHLHPHVDGTLPFSYPAFHKAAKPYVDIYKRDVAPHVDRAVQQAKDAHAFSSEYYEKEVHPRLKEHLYNGYVFTRHTAYPVAHKHYFTHAHPHLSKLYQTLSKWVDDLLVKYGLRNRSVLDSVLNNVKETYRQTEQVVNERLSERTSAPVAEAKRSVPEESTSASSVEASTVTPATTETATGSVDKSAASETAATEAAAPEIDEETGENVKVLQAQLDAELAAVDKALNAEQASISRVIESERKNLTEALVRARREMFIEYPELIEAAADAMKFNGLLELFSSMMTNFTTHAAKLDNAAQPSETWHTELDVIANALIDKLLVTYDIADASLSINTGLITDRGEGDRILIQDSIVRIRTQIRKSLHVFYELMDKAQFQVTYYENEGWDLGMKRRARHFREEMEEFLTTLTPTGEPIVPGKLVLPNFEEEKQQMSTQINAVLWETEKAVANLTARFKEQPTLFLERAGFGDFLVDVYEYSTKISKMYTKAAEHAALRLRKYIGDTREKLGLPRKPEEGILLNVWDLPAIEGTEIDAIPTAAATEGEWSSAEATYDPDSTGDLEEAMAYLASQTAPPAPDAAAATPEPTPKAPESVAADPEAVTPPAEAVATPEATAAVPVTEAAESVTETTEREAATPTEPAAAATPDSVVDSVTDAVADAAADAAALVAEIMQGTTATPEAPAPEAAATTEPVHAPPRCSAEHAAVSADVTDATPSTAAPHSSTAESELPTATASTPANEPSATILPITESTAAHDEL